MEKWKEIEGYDGSYLISNHGRVMSKKKDPIILRPSLSKAGYLSVSLWNGPKRVSWPIHRLVAIYYKKNPKKLKTVNHKNGDKLNNHEDNIEWMSQGENTRHAYKNGLNSTIGIPRKKRNLSSKFQGVTRVKSGRWLCRFTFNRKIHYVGKFETEMEAHQAYLKKREELLKEFNNGKP